MTLAKSHHVITKVWNMFYLKCQFLYWHQGLIFFMIFLPLNFEKSCLLIRIL